MLREPGFDFDRNPPVDYTDPAHEKTERQARALQRKQILETGDITPDASRILAQPLFQPGERVNIPILGSGVEDGWIVESTDPDSHTVKLTRRLPGGPIEHRLHEDTLMEYNP